MTLRFVQGFALGGEWGGAVLMSVEHAPAARRGLYGSFVALGLPAGLVLANLVFLVASAGMTREQFLAWGWRVPFLASAVLVVIGLFVRAGVTESPVFAEVRARNASAAAGRRRAPRPLAHGPARRGQLSVDQRAGLYRDRVLRVVRDARAGLPLTTTLAVLVSAALVLGVSLVTFATWSDRWGRRRIMTMRPGALGLWSLIFFPLIDTKSVPLIGLAVCGMMFLQGPYIGTQPAVFAEMFPATVRYSGASLSQTIGTILGGALAPMVATALLGSRRRLMAHHHLPGDALADLMAVRSRIQGDVPADSI